MKTPGIPVAYGFERRPRAEDQLARAVGAGDDVAADVVGVVLLHLRDAAHVASQDPVAETRGEALDLRLDRGGGVAVPACGHVRVGVQRMHVAGGARRVGQVLLADEDERPLGHPARGHERLARRDVAVAAADMDCPGPARLLVRPRHAARDREVDLERARPVPVLRKRTCDPARHPVAGDPRRGGRGDVEHDDVGLLDLVERRHADARLELGAVLLEQRDHRAGDRRRAALGDRPAVAVRRGAQGDADGRGHRRRERPEGVRRDAGEQRLRPAASSSGAPAAPPGCRSRARSGPSAAGGRGRAASAA